MRLLFYVAIFLSSNFVFGQTSLDQINLSNGKYKVGFRNYQTADSTRTYQRIFDWDNRSIPRPISVSIWYPAENVSGLKPLSVLGYMKIFAAEKEWEHLPDEQILNWFPDLTNTAENQKHLQEETIAFSNPTPLNGSFPVIIYAPGFELSSIENFALCEYLASHGYVVIASPSRGAENQFMSSVANGMETQARDIEFLIKEVSTYPMADMAKLATLGYSFGGLSNVLAQMRNDNIKAIVSLDGSIKYQYSTLKTSPFFNVEKVDVPFIHLAQKDIPQEVMDTEGTDPKLNNEFEFYDSLKYSSAYKLKFNNLTHSNFTTVGVLFSERDKRQDKSDAKIMASYRLVSLYVLNFLNAALSGDKNAMTFINNKPEANGIDSKIISYHSKKSRKRAFTLNDFNELATKQHYKNLNSLYAETLKKHPEVELPEWQLNNLGLQLQYNSKTEEQAIRVFEFATFLYPESANLFDSLAEAYLYSGDLENAKVNFVKSLALNPQNQNAVNRLKELDK